jgi:hypothetical protein
MLDRPPCQIGKVVEVPGSYWEGRMSEEERSIHYKCIIRDLSAAHRMDGARRVAHAGGRFSMLQEVGETGTGSLEHGDASGDIF